MDCYKVQPSEEGGKADLRQWVIDYSSIKGKLQAIGESANTQNSNPKDATPIPGYIPVSMGAEPINDTACPGTEAANNGYVVEQGNPDFFTCMQLANCVP